MKGNLDLEYSRRVAEEIGALPKQCWGNATLALLTMGQLQQDWARYVEGSAVWQIGEKRTSLPLEHGWLELPDGRIVDPTVVVTVGEEKEPAIRYFPAIRYDYAEVRWYADREAELPLVDYGSPDKPEPHDLGRRWSTPAYITAYQEALRAAVAQQWGQALATGEGQPPAPAYRVYGESLLARLARPETEG